MAVTDLLLSELLTLRGIDPKQCVLIRHVAKDKLLQECLKCGSKYEGLEEYQKLQEGPTFFKAPQTYKYIISFISDYTTL